MKITLVIAYVLSKYCIYRNEELLSRDLLLNGSLCSQEIKEKKMDILDSMGVSTRNREQFILIVSYITSVPHELRNINLERMSGGGRLYSDEVCWRQEPPKRVELLRYS